MSADATQTAPTRVPLEGMRRTIARRMTAAWQIPVFHLSLAVEMGVASVRRAAVPGASLTDVILRDCAQALLAHPELNAHYADDGITSFERVGLGIAVATDAGLTVPVVQRAEELDLRAFAEQRVELVRRARESALKPEHVFGGTFTVSNLGMFGIEQFDAILNPPQVAILAVGALQAQLRLQGGAVVEREIAQLTLTCDHRAVDGATGARFLQTLKQLLETGVDA